MRKAWEEGEEPVRDQATTRVRGDPTAIDIGKGVCFRVQSCNKHYKLPHPPCITLTLSDFCTDGSKGQRCRAAVEADSAQWRVKIDPWTQPYVVGVRRTTWMSRLIAYVQTHNGKWHKNMIFPSVMRRMLTSTTCHRWTRSEWLTRLHIRAVDLGSVLVERYG